jgi:hypothetical protein
MITLLAPERVPLAQLRKKGVATSISSTAKGSLRIVLSGGSMKLVKTLTLMPGEPRTPTFKLTVAQQRTAKKLKKVEVRAKLTLESGQEIVATRTVALKR